MEASVINVRKSCKINIFAIIRQRTSGNVRPGTRREHTTSKCEPGVCGISECSPNLVALWMGTRRVAVIAALFVQDGGCYFGLEGVDPWPLERDARHYPGTHRVVAHPPCE